MNNKFKTNLVALLAIVSGTALSTSTGLQNSANAQMPVGTGIVRPAESSHAGAFGAVAPAPQESSYYRQDLPPIVSPTRPSMSMPPIVSPDQASQGAMEGEPKVAKRLSKFQPKQPAILSPLAPIPYDEPAEESFGIDPNMAPPAIIQASNALGGASDNSKVAQAAQWGPGGYVQNATSSAGVPLYSGAITSHSAASSQPVGAPPIISSNSRLVSANITPPASYPAPPVVDPTYTPAQTDYSNPQYLSAPPVEAPVISSPVCNDCGGGCNGGCSTPVTSAVQSTPACGECSGGGCSNCGIASGVGGAVTSNCNSCGNNGCYNASSIAARAGTSGSVPAARRYIVADALYLTRDDGDIINSNFGGLNDFSWEGGARVTFGAKSDSLSGREFTYFGTGEFEESVTRTDSLGRISALFIGANGFSQAETSAFFNATNTTELKETELHSLEFNRVTWGWDVIKSFGGLRLIYIEDSYEQTSTNIFGESGNFELNTFNNLIGPHIGGEIFYDVGYRLSGSLVSKAGAFLNFNKVDTELTNAGATFINAEDDNVSISTSYELSLLGHYQLSQTARFRAGYNLLWVGEVATVSDNFNPILTPISASQTTDSGEMFFHGLSFGLEIFR